MNIDLIPLKMEERKYTYAQNSQLKIQTGSIGRLRGDFGGSGNDFYTSWDDHFRELKTEEFAHELDEVINYLRSEEGKLLRSRADMYCEGRKHPESAIPGSYTTEYGFRVNTEKYSYLFRCNTTKGDYNFYCFCYLRSSLDRHIENAQKDIRFVTSNYKELFRLPDGEEISIIHEDGKKENRICRYIDEYHTLIGDNIFHICEFAEKMENNHCHYEPIEEPLPPYCFSLLPSTGEIIKIKRYENGYIPLKVRPQGDAQIYGAEPLNEAIGVSKAQAAAMFAGSLFGWDCPAAKPKNYNENGELFKQNSRER